MSGSEDAKATLLRALEQIERAEADLGEGGEVRYLCVVYSATKRLDDDATHEVGGWVNTSDPLWLHAAMLRRAADALDKDARTDDDEPDDPFPTFGDSA